MTAGAIMFLDWQYILLCSTIRSNKVSSKKKFKHFTRTKVSVSAVIGLGKYWVSFGLRWLGFHEKSDVVGQFFFAVWTSSWTWGLIRSFSSFYERLISLSAKLNFNQTAQLVPSKVCHGKVLLVSRIFVRQFCHIRGFYVQITSIIYIFKQIQSFIQNDVSEKQINPPA